MDAKVQSFIQKYNGVMIAFQENAEVPAGSCMNVPHQFIFEVLGLTDPHIIYGADAYMVYTNFANLPAAKYFTLVPNSATNVPSAGDIPVFGQTNDTPVGHICLATGTGDINSFQSFDMDYPYGSPAHLVTHNYTGLLGWLHFNDPAASPTQNVTVTDQQAADLLNAQIQATSSCQQQLKTANDTITSLQDKQQKDQDLIESLEGKLSDANAEITIIQKQLQSEQSEIVHLNQTIETQANSNKNYGQEILDLTHANQDLKNYLNATSDTLGLTRTGEKDADIQEHIMEKLSEVDLLLKAAGLAQGLLHQVAKTFSVDAPDDKTAANNIISYVKQLGGKLQSLVPQQQQATVEQQIQSPSFWSKFIGLWWQPKST